MPGARREGRARLVDAATLIAIATVVLAVSLPRLSAFALRENEDDARRLVARFGEVLAAAAPSPREGSIGELIERLGASIPLFARRLDDAELLEGGALLRRHGYLFDLVPPEPAAGRPLAVRAWPWAHGRSGHAAFVWTPRAGVVGHRNGDGLWSGPQRPPPVAADPGWVRLSRLD